MPYHYIKIPTEPPQYIGSPALINSDRGKVPNFQKDITRAGLFDSDRLENVLKILPKLNGLQLVRL